MKTLNSSDRHLLSLALRMAAHTFAKDALTPIPGALVDLSEQFKRQAEDAKRLAEWIDEADEVLIDNANLEPEHSSIWDGKASGGGTFERGE